MLKTIVTDFSFIDTAQQAVDYLVLLNRPINPDLLMVLMRCSRHLAVADGGANRLHELNLNPSLKP
jgi:thiamine pyrophosphokinase